VKKRGKKGFLPSNVISFQRSGAYSPITHSRQHVRGEKNGETLGKEPVRGIEREWLEDPTKRKKKSYLTEHIEIYYSAF
jgi:hypothetical protein